MAPSAFLSPDPLSVAELSAARLDGDLARVSRTGYAPSLLPPSATVRAGAARDVLADGLVAVGVTAAWVHGALAHEPDPHEVQRLAGTPVRRHWRAGVISHAWPMPPGDVETIAGAHITTIERTCYDVSRAAFTGGGRPDQLEAIRWFVARTDLHPRILAWLRRGRRLRYTARTARLLETGQDEVTRYTS
ncbi:type IV toxin-antitoxin system AbiEi family antitoxin [Microbacterium karelineae]|uniref:type IV toxin-antitoxin system AbiEi family antitoxin n=1 Tax=Microbacterium karelineae TaxID=2654283 RepID=UPI0012EA33B4|nr:hypothetical protein [Microbacterium karelineae]